MEWVEAEQPSADVLRWYAQSPPDSRLRCPPDLTAGCARPGEVLLHAAAWIPNFHDLTHSKVRYPAQILYENGLHEAMHALYDARHSTVGLMCIAPSCYRPLSEGETTWGRGLRLRPLDSEVFTLYGSLENDMTLAEVVELVVAR